MCIRNIFCGAHLWPGRFLNPGHATGSRLLKHKVFRAFLSCESRALGYMGHLGVMLDNSGS